MAGNNYINIFAFHNSVLSTPSCLTPIPFRPFVEDRSSWQLISNAKVVWREQVLDLMKVLHYQTLQL